jgi:ribosome-associated heat shock protein Hsp15
LDRQRIDKWLWHARVVRTRSAAAALVTSGHVRLNGQRNDAASRPVRAGDVVTVALDRTVRVLKVKGFAERRGAAESTLALYEDLTPPKPREAEPDKAAVAVREPGDGRPTKRERRATDRLRGGDDF